MKNKLVMTLSALLFVAVLMTSGQKMVFAGNDSSTSPETTTAMRMEPLVSKYNSLTQKDLDAELAKYTDTTTHWGKDYISGISALGIISGYGNNKFGPNDTLLCGQYVLMLVKTIGYSPEVPQGIPYYQPFVNIAIQEGIIKKDEITDYMKPISRELAASLARRVAGKYEEVPSDYFVPGDDPDATGEKGFFDNVYVGYQKAKMTDFSSIDNKNMQDVIDCYRMGLLTGSNNKFNPKENLTRSEGAVIVVKLIDKSKRVESVPQANEKFKLTNKLTAYPENRTESHGKYENKEYTIYKGRFPLPEIWGIAYVMNKYLNKINGGAYDQVYNEKTHQFVTEFFPTTEIEEKSRMDNPYGLILSLNTVYINSEKTQLKKGEQFNIFDNADGYLYRVNSSDIDNYNKSFKPYVNELLKVWFGDEYAIAKKLHDKYLDYALKRVTWKTECLMLNGRQVMITGGQGMGGPGLEILIWAKHTITEETMFKMK